MVQGASYSPGCPTHQTDAVLTQAAPVQNTWYTVLDTVFNVRIYYALVMVATVGETLEFKLTIDGVTITGSVAAAADTYYSLYKSPQAESLATISLAIDLVMLAYKHSLEGRSVKLEVRKTTATGAGTLNGRVTYAKW